MTQLAVPVLAFSGIALLLIFPSFPWIGWALLAIIVVPLIVLIGAFALVGIAANLLVIGAIIVAVPRGIVHGIAWVAKRIWPN